MVDDPEAGIFIISAIYSDVYNKILLIVGLKPSNAHEKFYISIIINRSNIIVEIIVRLVKFQA